MNRWILDVGNTRAKWARFSEGISLGAPPVQVESVSSEDVATAQNWASSVGAEDAVMVTGSGPVEVWAAAFPKAWVLRPGDETPLPTRVVERQTLGLDRVANAFAVMLGCVPQADPQGAWMLVDAGTCVTVDVVQRGMHLGGSISPGVAMRLESMARGTARLPRVAPAEQSTFLNLPGALGLKTKEAMVAGAWGGLSAEILGKWESLRQEVPNLGLILTGGDAEGLELRDIHPKFADAHLTLKGYHALFTHAHPTL